MHACHGLVALLPRRHGATVMHHISTRTQIEFLESAPGTPTNLVWHRSLTNPQDVSLHASSLSDCKERKHAFALTPKQVGLCPTPQSRRDWERPTNRRGVIHRIDNRLIPHFPLPTYLHGLPGHQEPQTANPTASFCTSCPKPPSITPQHATTSRSSLRTGGLQELGGHLEGLLRLHPRLDGLVLLLLHLLDSSNHLVDGPDSRPVWSARGETR